MKLKEIAAQTGVSPSAVSLVMHGRPGVGAAKREQIMRLLEENGYAADKPRLRRRMCSGQRTLPGRSDY